MKILLWKEAREQSSLVLAFVAICYLLKAFFWYAWPQADQWRLAVQVAVVGLPILGMVLGGAAIAREFDHKTMALLLTRPIGRGTIFASKIVTIVAGLLVAFLAVSPLMLSRLESQSWLEMALVYVPMVALSTSCALVCSFFTRNSVRATVLGALAAVSLATALFALLYDGPSFAMALVSALLIRAAGSMLARADLFNLRSRLRTGLRSLAATAPLAVLAFLAHSWLTVHHPARATVFSLGRAPAAGVLYVQWSHYPWLDATIASDCDLTLHPLDTSWKAPPDLEGRPGTVLGVSPDASRWVVVRARNACGLVDDSRLMLHDREHGWKQLDVAPRSRRGLPFEAPVWSHRADRFAYLKRLEPVRDTGGTTSYPWQLWTVDATGTVALACDGTTVGWEAFPAHFAFSPDDRELWIGRPAEGLRRFDLTRRTFLDLPHGLRTLTEDLARFRSSPASGRFIAEVNRGTRRANALYAAQPGAASWELLMPEVTAWQLSGDGGSRLVATLDRGVGARTLLSRDLASGQTVSAELTTPVEVRVSPDGRHISLVRQEDALQPLTVRRAGSPGEPPSAAGDLFILDAATLRVVFQTDGLDLAESTSLWRGRRRNGGALSTWITPTTLALLDATTRHDKSPGKLRLFRTDGTEGRL